MRVEEKWPSQPGPQGWEEEVLDLRTGLHDTRFDYLELMLDGVLALYVMGPVITALCVGCGLTTPGRGMLPIWS